MPLTSCGILPAARKRTAGPARLGAGRCCSPLRSPLTWVALDPQLSPRQQHQFVLLPTDRDRTERRPQHSDEGLRSCVERPARADTNSATSCDRLLTGTTDGRATTITLLASRSQLTKYLRHTVNGDQLDRKPKRSNPRLPAFLTSVHTCPLAIPVRNGFGQQREPQPRKARGACSNPRPAPQYSPTKKNGLNAQASKPLI